MNDIEKIAREYAQLMRDLQGSRDAYLIRIMRNKRLPISERYAACMHYWPGHAGIPPDHSDESLIEEINGAIADYERSL